MEKMVRQKMGWKLWHENVWGDFEIIPTELCYFFLIPDTSVKPYHAYA